MNMRLKAIGIGTVVLGVAVVMGTAQIAAAQEAARTPAPTTEAKVWTLEDLNKVAKELLVTKANNWSFYSEPSFNAEIRNLTGKQPVLQHKQRADFMIMREGGGTFVTGGELVDAKPQNNRGDLIGTSVKGGVSRVVKPGDIIYIPPGVPHYFSNIPDHAAYTLVRWDIKDTK
jgi:mannose-6-phosphate isomerase-like protein (cupin superfamily)